MSRVAQSSLAAHWGLDPAIDFLNHGSFGACPRVVLEAQQRWRERLEREPVAFILRELPEALDEARGVLAELVGADADDVCFVNNTTTGVNTVLRSLQFAPGDELLTTNHTYNACRNALEFVAARTGARVVVADVPFPLQSPNEVTEAVLACATERTRLALLDHITSPTALIFPIEELVNELNARGVDTLVDGAHAPGMVPIDLDALGAAYYTGNCHKWLCAPKGSALLHVRRDRQALIRPLVLSHGMNTPNGDRSLFRREFDYQGTQDPTPFLCVVDAIRFLESVRDGGLAQVMSTNHALALQARKTLCDRLGIAPPAPESMIGAMASLALSQTPSSLQDDLFHQDKIEVPLLPGPHGNRYLRVTAQLYNTADQYERLAGALVRRIKQLPSG